MRLLFLSHPLFFNIKSNLKYFIHLDDALSIKTNNVFVHCSGGISRSPTLVLAYMIKKCHMALDDAFTKMRQLRKIVDPNIGFIVQLRDWEKQSLTKTTMTRNEVTNDNTSITNASTRSASSTYIGSTPKNKTDGKPCTKSTITVN